ncbi:MAG: xylulokinase, partial [Bdellovibrionales bacterium]|nr:xylulokinase [Bdellovibrionales bacterium]
SPSLWWDGAIVSIREVIAKTGIDPAEIAGVGLTGQMHGLVLLDGEGNVLRPSILWNDQRTAAQCDEIRARLGKARLIELTGNDALTGFTAPKILWVRDNEPEVYARVRHILLPKDYVRYQLTGKPGMDVADGAGTILIDLRTRSWSADVLDALGIPHEWLPPLYEGPEITGHITAAAAAATGLKEGTPIMAGGGDQAAQAVGVGAVREGIIALTLGTSGVVFGSVDKPFFEPEGRLHAFCHSAPATWHLMGVMLAAAGSLSWLKEQVFPTQSFDDLTRSAKAAPAGSDGLFFLPYLTGERTPHADPLARGGFIGLTARHGQAHMVRAVLEGVGFALRDSYELVARHFPSEQATELRITGGGARSQLWNQVIADILNTPLTTLRVEEGAAYGAALLGGVAAGVWSSLEEATAETIHPGPVVQPSKDRTLYEDRYALYRQLYPALRETFHRLGS